MPIDPNNPKQLQRLVRSIEWSHKKLEPFRRTRKKAIGQYTGARYLETADKKDVVVNLLELLVNTYSRSLAARNPRALISTPHQSLKPAADTLELAANNLIGEINFSETLRQIVVDALFCIGIRKVGVSPSTQFELMGDRFDVGQPYFDRIDLVDWVHDMNATHFDRVSYCGNVYELPFEQAMDSGLFDKAAKERLEALSKFSRESGDQYDPINESTGSDKDSDAHAYESIRLLDLYIPTGVVGEAPLLLTLPAWDAQGLVRKGDKPLRVVDFQGPEMGPYDILSYNTVPNNIMPLSPVQLMLPLHELANTLYRKMGRQAERQKDLTAFRGASEEDAKRVVEGSDGDTIKIETDPSAIANMKFGGIDQTSLVFFLNAKQMFDQMGGNLSLLGGLGSQAETLGQDQLLARNASQRMSDMQERTIAFTKRAVRDIAWHMFYDPLIDIPLVKRTPNGLIEIPVRFSAEEREGDFLDYNFNIDPFSLQPDTPQTKLQKLMQLVTQVILPMQPMLEGQGIQFNLESFLRLYGDLNNMPELNDILMFFGQGGQDPPIVGEPPRQSPVTTRTNIRENRSTASQQSQETQMMQALMGGEQMGPQALASMAGGM